MIEGPFTAAGIVLGVPTIAASASYPWTFAQGAPANNVGTTKLGGALTFVAPTDYPIGTYISTMTMTLTSD